MPEREEESKSEIAPLPGGEEGETDSFEPAPLPAGKRRRRITILLIFLVALIACASLVWAVLLPCLLPGSGGGRIGGGSSGGEMTVSFDFRYDLHLMGEDSLVEFTVVLPETLDRRQEVLDLNINPRPQEIFDREGNRYARFEFRDPQGDLTVSIEVKALLLGYDLDAAREEGGVEGGGVEEGLEAFLVAETYLEKDDAGVAEAARDIQGGSDLEIVEGIFAFVLSNMSYGEYEPGEVGAAKALCAKEGDCTEYTDLMVAMCRARGIPAKSVEGYYVDDDEGLYAHNWVEVYLEDYGWVPFDPTFADSGNATLSRLDPVFLTVSRIRNDETLGLYHFWYYYYEGDPVEVSESLRFTLE
jgi:hypothetical protein